ncbi:hypothetical protein QA802_41250 [Streptomyces sp. B21-105]|uniref:hypothetical protein n=1 Tax=Streptomyces sp. B21-105 TaxID=3039417 RepID=UPI002FF3DC38
MSGNGMRLFLFIGSSRVRAVLLWLAHWPAFAFTPLCALGLRSVLGWPIPGWAPPTAGWITAVLIAATLAGGRLHKELDVPGIPCRWCDFELEEDQA